MRDYAVIGRINELLDSTSPDTVSISMRIPTVLWEAAALAAGEPDPAPWTTVLTVNALRAALRAVVTQTVLDRHFGEHPGSRPPLADLAIAAADIDGHPLAGQPELIRQAAAEVRQRHPDASPEDVLLWAEARASAPA